METHPPSEAGTDLARCRWMSLLLGGSLGATFVSFLYPILRYLVPPAASEPSLSEFELDIKASAIALNSGRIVSVGGRRRQSLLSRIRIFARSATWDNQDGTGCLVMEYRPCPFFGPTLSSSLAADALLVRPHRDGGEAE